MVQLARFTIAFTMYMVSTALSHAQCPADHDRLLDALKNNVKASGGPTNGGFDTNEWAAIVDRNGLVCAVAFSGSTVGAQTLPQRTHQPKRQHRSQLPVIRLEAGNASHPFGIAPGKDSSSSRR